MRKTETGSIPRGTQATIADKRMAFHTARSTNFPEGGPDEGRLPFFWLMPKAIILDAQHILWKRFAISQKVEGASKVPASLDWLKHLTRVAGNHTAHAIIAAFDNPSRHRLDILPEYKGQRAEKPPEFIKQRQACIDLCKACGVPVLEHHDHEADDLAASAASILVNQGFKVSIETGDTDYYQLASDNISIWKPLGPDMFEAFGPERIFDEKALHPEEIPLYLAIKGDGSDNIPGVPGIGKKKAVKAVEAKRGGATIIEALRGVLPKNSPLSDQELTDIVERNLRLTTFDLSCAPGNLSNTEPDPCEAERIANEAGHPPWGRRTLSQLIELTSSSARASIPFEPFKKSVKTSAAEPSQLEIKPAPAPSAPNMRTFEEIFALIENEHLHSQLSYFHEDCEHKMKEFPASIKYHHCYPGGYFDHVLEVCNNALNILESLPMSEEAASTFTRDELIAAAYLHDVDKLMYRYQPNKDKPSDKQAAYARGLGIQVDPDETPDSISMKIDAVKNGRPAPDVSRLPRHTWKDGTPSQEDCGIVMFIAARAGISALSPNVVHAISFHHGGWNPYIQANPSIRMHPIATILHMADIASSGMQDGMPATIHPSCAQAKAETSAA